MITFNPGPSQISANIKDHLQHLAMGNFLSLSHRSGEFTSFFKTLQSRFRSAFSIPANYEFFFLPSATAAMSVAIGNLSRTTTTHLVHGAFSGRFASTAEEMGRKVNRIEAEPDQPIPWRQTNLGNESEFIAITHNETSTGLMWPLLEISELRQAHPNPILAIDVTSSFGAIPFDISQADVWFGSIQKVLGLPAGMGFIILSERAMQLSSQLGPKGLPAWLDLDKLQPYYEKHQTLETPSALHLALLSEQLADWDLEDIYGRTVKKAERMYSVFSQPPFGWKPFVKEPHWCSLTVVAFEVDQPTFWREQAQRGGFILGKGYGSWKDKHLRLANFPAHTAVDFQMLFQTLRDSARA